MSGSSICMRPTPRCDQDGAQLRARMGSGGRRPGAGGRLRAVDVLQALPGPSLWMSSCVASATPSPGARCCTGATGGGTTPRIWVPQARRHGSRQGQRTAAPRPWRENEHLRGRCCAAFPSPNGSTWALQWSTEARPPSSATASGASARGLPSPVNAAARSRRRASASRMAWPNFERPSCSSRAGFHPRHRNMTRTGRPVKAVV